jgi:hypothetical protein
MRPKPDSAGAQESSQVEREDKPVTPASRIAQDAQAAMASGKTGIKATRWRGPAQYKSKTTR